MMQTLKSGFIMLSSMVISMVPSPANVTRSNNDDRPTGKIFYHIGAALKNFEMFLKFSLKVGSKDVMRKKCLKVSTEHNDML
jgi:hypothetical protein